MHIDLPLHGGQCPRWLFEKMVKLSEKFLVLFVKEKGREELLAKLSDPLWFQSLGCYLGFDWHSSGLTTVVGGALSQALRNINYEIGIYTAGGKGKTALKTPDTIQEISYKNNIFYYKNYISSSRIIAKVDNTMIQDGFDIYYHLIFFDHSGKRTLIQQGMNQKYARRYHRNRKIGNKLIKTLSKSSLEDYSQGLDKDDFNIISSLSKQKSVLNLASQNSSGTRNDIVEIVNHIRKHYKMPDHHLIRKTDVNTEKLVENMKKIRKDIYSFRDLLETKGVGPKSILNLVHTSQLICGNEADRKDPARFSFTHGGKDGTPYSPYKKEFNDSIKNIEKLINKSEKDLNTRNFYLP